MAEVHRIEAALPRLVVDADGAPAPIPAAGIGAPARRQDGMAKVTGAAVYASEKAPAGTLHGVLVLSPIARGRVLGLETAAASAAKGVTHVLTPQDMPALGKVTVPPVGQSFLPMSDLTIRYEGQPLAIVLAETLEQAEHGAGLVGLRLELEEPVVFETGDAVTPKSAEDGNGFAFAELDGATGDPDAAMVRATQVVDEIYVTPTRHHNPMEPSATLADWRGDELHIHDATQWTFGIRTALAALLELEPDKIHVRCPYTGGGFGAKGYVWPHQVLTPIAARIAGRPVKLALGREAFYSGSGYQPTVRSRVRLAAGADGRLLAVTHDTENVTSRFDDYVEFGSAGTRSMYQTEALAFSTRVRRADVGTPTAMRAPKLREAYAEGARRIGWADRAPEPRARRENGKLIGLGMASAIMSTFRFAAHVRLALAANGSVTVEAGSQEIGTGTRTVLAQVAADRLGIPVERVAVELGSTALPETGPTTGSSTTLSVGSAVASAADRLQERLRGLAGTETPPRAETWPDLLISNGVSRLEAEGSFDLPGGAPFDAHGGEGEHSMHTFGAIFVEMEVDEDLGIARMRRAAGCYSAGRILNPVTARSQMIGGIILGYGRAILEESAMDPRYGRYLSKKLSGVLLPVNADIPREVDVCFIEEHDPHASALGARGIGELGEVGVAAAITNAIFHATGRRIRDLPVHFHHLLG